MTNTGLEESSTGEVPRLQKFCHHNYWVFAAPGKSKRQLSAESAECCRTRDGSRRPSREAPARTATGEPGMPPWTWRALAWVANGVRVIPARYDHCVPVVSRAVAFCADCSLRSRVWCWSGCSRRRDKAVSQRPASIWRSCWKLDLVRSISVSCIISHLHFEFAVCTLPSVLWRCWLGGRKGIRPVKNWVVGVGMVICLERGADLHMAQLMPLPLTVSCFSIIQIGFIFLVPTHSGSPGQRAVKRVCVCVCTLLWLFLVFHTVSLYFCACTCVYFPVCVTRLGPRTAKVSNKLLLLLLNCYYLSCLFNVHKMYNVT